MMMRGFRARLTTGTVIYIYTWDSSSDKMWRVACFDSVPAGTQVCILSMDCSSILLQNLLHTVAMVH